MNAFTDGVIAILITILVLELRPPEGDHLGDILDEKGKLLAYMLSFVFVAIYWVNHHHLMQVVHRIDGRTLWANIHLLFWLSLTPVATAWLGEAGVETGPVAAYAIVLLGCAIAYTLLTLALLALHEAESQLAQAIGSDRKGKLSLVAYVVALALRVRRAVGLGRALRDGRDDLVRPRPAGRARGHPTTGSALSRTTLRASPSVTSTTSTGTKLASTAALRLAIDRDGVRPIRFFASPPVSTTPASWSSCPSPMYCRDLDVAHLLLRRDGRVGRQAVRILRFRRGVVPGAGPGRQREQDPRVLAREHGVPLARLQQDHGAFATDRRAALARDFHRPARDLDDGPFVDCVIAELLARGEVDHDHARLGRREEHPRVGPACGLWPRARPRAARSTPLDVRFVAGER